MSISTKFIVSEAFRIIWATETPTLNGKKYKKRKDMQIKT